MTSVTLFTYPLMPMEFYFFGVIKKGYIIPSAPSLYGSVITTLEL